MANALLCIANKGDPYYDPTLYPALTTRTPAFAGGYGSWAAGNPLTNLQDVRLWKTARSTDATLASTKFRLDLGAAVFMNFFGFARHNFSLLGKYRIRGGTDATYASFAFDSAWQDVFPSQAYAPSTLPFGAGGGFDGKPLAEDLASYPSLCLGHYDATISASMRYLQIEFDDTTNNAGYVDIGRFHPGIAYQPQLNFAYGASFGVNNDTTTEKTQSGVPMFTPRLPYRQTAITFKQGRRDEITQLVIDTLMKCGRDKQVFFVQDPSATYQKYRTCFLATVDAPEPFTIDAFDEASAPIKLIEVIA